MQLFIEFFKTGLFAIGGGLATLPFLTEMADKTGWFTREMLADMIAVSESTPGPIGVNMATYVGFHTAGILGALVSTIGLVSPSIVIILIVARFLQKFSENKLVKGAFYGLRPAVAALILAASIEVIRMALFTLPTEGVFTPWWNAIFWPGLALFIVLFFAMRKWKVHPIIFIALSAGAGIGFYYLGWL